MTVEFTIPGKITSANLVTRHMAFVQQTEDGPKAAARAYKPADVKADMERIASLATAAKMLSGWRVPEQARMSVLAFNSLLDVGNIEKTIGDSIKGGLLIIDDRPKHLKSLFVEHQDKDHLGERYVVRVESIHDGLPL